ncbi:MAG: hypothetical protein KDE45_22700 [Caldilineaceae bacterium]|nr:hypothetical protein [Caldilineaceae bacterium]
MNFYRPLRRVVVLAVGMLALAACAPVRPMPAMTDAAAVVSAPPAVE